MEPEDVCQEIDASIILYVEGSLEPHDWLRLSRHILECKQCRNLEMSLRTAYTLLRQLPRVHIPDDAARASLERALEVAKHLEERNQPKIDRDCQSETPRDVLSLRPQGPGEWLIQDIQYIYELFDGDVKFNRSDGTSVYALLQNTELPGFELHPKHWLSVAGLENAEKRTTGKMILLDGTTERFELHSLSSGEFVLCLHGVPADLTPCALEIARKTD